MVKLFSILFVVFLFFIPIYANESSSKTQENLIHNSAESSEVESPYSDAKNVGVWCSHKALQSDYIPFISTHSVGVCNPPHELNTPSDISDSSQKRNIYFHFIVGIGISSSINNEYVFENSKMISHLEWKQYASPVMQANARLSFFGAFVQVEMLSAIPLKCGILNDYDFLLPNSNAISQYSHHSIYLDKRFDFSFKTGYAFKIKRITLSPYAQITYRLQKWAAHDGYLQYPAGGKWTGTEAKQELSGNIISYEQSIFLPQFAFRFAGQIANAWKLSMHFAICPYIVADTLDSHFLRKRQFFDTLRGGFAFTIGAQVEYKKFSISFEYEWLRVLNGTTQSSVIGNASSLTKDANTSGIKTHLFTGFIKWRM